jgi:hypothetical protein
VFVQELIFVVTQEFCFAKAEALLAPRRLSLLRDASICFFILFSPSSFSIPDRVARTSCIIAIVYCYITPFRTIQWLLMTQTVG